MTPGSRSHCETRAALEAQSRHARCRNSGLADIRRGNRRDNTGHVRYRDYHCSCLHISVSDCSMIDHLLFRFRQSTVQSLQAFHTTHHTRGSLHKHGSLRTRGWQRAPGPSGERGACSESRDAATAPSQGGHAGGDHWWWMPPRSPGCSTLPRRMRSMCGESCIVAQANVASTHSSMRMSNKRLLPLRDLR
jgi:hypothetical protein